MDGCVLCRIYKNKERTQRKKKGRNDDRAEDEDHDNMQGGGGEEEQAPPPDDQFPELLSYFNDDTNDTPSLACILGPMNNDANNTSTTTNNNIVDNEDDNNNNVGGGSVFYVNDDSFDFSYLLNSPKVPAENISIITRSYNDDSYTQIIMNNHPTPQAYQHYAPPQAAPQPVESFQNSISMFHNHHPPQEYQHYYAPPPPTQAAPQPVQSFQNSSSSFQAAAHTFRIQQRIIDAYLAQQAQKRFHPSFAVPQQPHTSRGADDGAEEEEEEEDNDNDDNMQGGGGGEEQQPPPPPDHLSFTLAYFESLNTYNNNIIVYNDEDKNNNVGVFEEKNEILEYIKAMFLTDDLPLRLKEAFSRSDNDYDTQTRCQDLCCATSHTHMNHPRPPPQATAQPDDALQNSSMFQEADDPSDAMLGQDAMP